jgi:hypothetical protein
LFEGMNCAKESPGTPGFSNTGETPDERAIDTI